MAETIQGLAALQASLARLQNAPKETIRRAMARCGLIAVREAKANAPLPRESKTDQGKKINLDEQIHKKHGQRNCHGRKTQSVFAVENDFVDELLDFRHNADILSHF